MACLYAEDDPVIRDELTRFLTKEGFDVRTASDSSAAMILISDLADFTLLVTDIEMPGATGITVAQAARAQHPGVPILFVSGRPELRSGTAVFPPPCQFLTKPFRLNLLLQTIAQLCATVPIGSVALGALSVTGASIQPGPDTTSP